VALFAAGVLIAQDTPAAKTKPAASKTKYRKKSTRKASTSKNTGTKNSPPKPATQTALRSKAHSKPSKSKTAVTASRRSSQQQPTTERYQEIQQALADKGYFSGPVDGNWGPESVDALRRFQREQNLTDDGKLGSLSLIALGLGPKRPEPVDKAAQR
jgi:peptidoglycan hydrolase-like protein with peptidoglycan-binding domain